MERAVTHTETYTVNPSKGDPKVVIVGTDRYDLQSYSVHFERISNPTREDAEDRYFERVEVVMTGHRLNQKDGKRDPRSRGHERVYGGRLARELADGTTDEGRFLWGLVVDAHNAHQQACEDVDMAAVLRDRAERIGQGSDEAAQAFERAKRSRTHILNELRSTVQRIATVGA